MRTALLFLGALLLLAACSGPDKKPDLPPPPPAPASFDRGPPHPLDPLSEDEIAAALEHLRSARSLPAGALFPFVVLHEPPKAEVLAHAPGRPFRREALVVVVDRAAGQTAEALVDLTGKKLLEWRELPGVQAGIMAEEFDTLPDVVRADARWQAAIRKRGITDLENVHPDIWAPGHLGVQGVEGARVVRAVSFYRGKRMNPYGRPIEGVIALVDVAKRAVVDVVDTGIVPLAADTQDLDPASIGKQRPRLAPLVIQQPEGTGFALRGQAVEWDRWRFRWSVHPREGLVLHQVGWDEGLSVRPILYRASLSEMVVPYGDPSGNWAWRSAFDEGEYGLGRFLTPLLRGGEVPENAVLLDAVMADETGVAERRPGLVGIYERDGGVLWKHWDDEVGHLEVRRARELVVVTWVTIGNYDYGMNWIFHQDGTLELELELSGILLAKGVAAATCAGCPSLAAGEAPAEEGAETRFGVLVDQRVLAPNHQHFVNVRLDFDVDGTENSALEMNARGAEAGPNNELGNAVVMERTLLPKELAARRQLDSGASRKWELFNPTKPGPLGHLPGYVLLPGESSQPHAPADGALRKRAGFVEHHVWITRMKPDEVYAGGAWPNQGREGQGLPVYAADDEPLVSTDIVLWYTFGVMHGPRVEEWPVMSTHRVGFKLVPRGFFTRNPALDVPPPWTIDGAAKQE